MLAPCIFEEQTKTADHGEDSYTFRIVESVREGTQVKQRTLLNLGKDFAIEPAHGRCSPELNSFCKARACQASCLL